LPKDATGFWVNDFLWLGRWLNFPINKDKSADFFGKTRVMTGWILSCAVAGDFYEKKIKKHLTYQSKYVLIIPLCNGIYPLFERVIRGKFQ